MHTALPYHDGERRIQQQTGESDIAVRTGRAIADAILPGALKFIDQLPMAVLSSLDADGDVWASLLLGAKGFMRAQSRLVTFDLSQTASMPDDPLWVNIERDARLGGLFIELGSRRRLRINGRVQRNGSNELQLAVIESYPNCPKYIQRRHLTGGFSNETSINLVRHDERSLSKDDIAQISESDTFFVASAHPQHGLDASHRGGPPGFVRVLDESTLRIPDYVGNSMFNTLGNFDSYPHAGLLFFDFVGGRILQLTGRPKLRFALPGDATQTGGTQRWWDFHITRVLQSSLSDPPQWEFLDYSPHNPGG